MPQYAILIIGGGPGGLSTALHLQRLAPQLASRTLILEKGHYPRNKLCAGGLTLDAEVILERLGLDVTEVPHVNVRQIRFDFEGKGLLIRNEKKHALRVIRRDEFDCWLAGKVRKSGIEIREGVTVKQVVPADDGVTVHTDHEEFHAQVAIGADGSNGITRRCILPHEAVYTARALEVLTPSHPPQKLKGPGEDGRGQAAYFDFFPVPHNIAGYVWDFPTQLNGEPMRCWGIYDANLLSDFPRPALKEPLSQEMKRIGYELNDYELKGHPIHWYGPGVTAAVPRVMLVGDAVGADPIFGEGISLALGYGAVAAREIQGAFERNNFSFRRYGRRLIQSGLGQTLLARWFIAGVIYPLKWKWFQILLWRWLKPILILVAHIFVLNWSRRLR